MFLGLCSPGPQEKLVVTTRLSPWLLPPVALGGGSTGGGQLGLHGKGGMGGCGRTV